MTVGAGDHCPQLGQAEYYTYSRVPGGADDVTAAAALPRRRVSDAGTILSTAPKIWQPLCTIPSLVPSAPWMQATMTECYKLAKGISNT